MTCSEIQKLNETILLSTHKACLIDIDRACICYSLHRNVAELIANISVETLKTVSSNSNALIHPGLIPLGAWQNIELLKDDALSTISTIQKFPNT